MGFNPIHEWSVIKVGALCAGACSVHWGVTPAPQQRRSFSNIFIPQCLNTAEPQRLFSLHAGSRACRTLTGVNSTRIFISLNMLHKVSTDPNKKRHKASSVWKEGCCYSIMNRSSKQARHTETFQRSSSFTDMRGGCDTNIQHNCTTGPLDCSGSSELMAQAPHYPPRGVNTCRD